MKKSSIFQYRTNWIPAKMKSTTIKSARVGDAHMDILAINLAMGLEKYPRVDDLLNMTVRQFARNVSSIFESTEKMKLAKFKTFDECSSKFISAPSNNNPNLYSECTDTPIFCDQCHVQELFFQANHAIRRLNSKTPHSFHKKCRDKVFEPEVDSWTLLHNAQSKWITAMKVSIHKLRNINKYLFSVLAKKRKDSQSSIHKQFC